MAVFGRRVSETEYGIRIYFDTKNPKEKWYGSDREKRDRAHNMCVENSNVTVVEDIERSK